MLQVHFTAQDLMRVGFASQPAPLMELGLAAAALQRRDCQGVFGRWRADRRRGLPSAALPLFRLVPPNGAGPLFLDPLCDTLEDGLDRVRSAPRELVVRELRRVCPAYRPLTPWVRDLARQDRQAWSVLEDALRAGHRALLSGHWDRMQASFYADLAWRGRLLADQGVGAVLASLYPGSRWSGTTLQIDSARDSEMTLTGGGLTLMPSSVWTGQPLVGYDTDGRYLFVYPALTPLPMISERPGQRPAGRAARPDPCGRPATAVAPANYQRDRHRPGDQPCLRLAAHQDPSGRRAGFERTRGQERRAHPHPSWRQAAGADRADDRRPSYDASRPLSRVRRNRPTLGSRARDRSDDHGAYGAMVTAASSTSTTS